MSSRTSEIEFKFNANHVTEAAFLAWGVTQNPESYEHTSWPDLYYAQEDSIVRHRWSDGAGELTVKRRKSQKSITDRVEVDLKFGPDVKCSDVSMFLTASGFKRVLTLFKEFVHVFRIKNRGAEVTVALYEVDALDERTHKRVKVKRFIEVEVEKGGPLSDRDAMIMLEKYRDALTTQFKLDSPVTESLFEIYTGRRYKILSKRLQGRG